MLFLHETHSVRGAREAEFDASFRDGWMKSLASIDGARLLYFLRQAPGSGSSYRVVTITGLHDGAAWEDLARRVETGELADWAAGVDELRHDVEAKILVPLPWSPLQRLDLRTVPVEPVEKPLSLFMEDTVWPNQGQLGAYIERSGSHYAREMKTQPGNQARILTVDASFRTAFGSGRRREIVLWQKVQRPEGLQHLLFNEIPAKYKQPGNWMHDALELRDQWQSRLLRTSSWSPLH